MDTILELKNISKTFGATKALSDISLEFRKGEIHALVGENGAGKSTLIKILSGVYEADTGEVFLNGQRANFHSPTAAQRAGISTLFQEIQELPSLTVAENIFIGSGREPRKGGFIDWKKLRRQAKELLESLHLNIDAAKKMEELNVSSRKMVEIARAVTFHAQIVIMDEPTANLNEEELQALFGMIDHLKSQNVTIIYISHRLREVFQLADRITVLRDGKHIKTMNESELDEKSLVNLMIGREIQDLYPGKIAPAEDEILQVRDFGVEGLVEGVSFHVKRKEILGFAGLEASGANVVTKALYGLFRGGVKGTVTLDGKSYRVDSPRASLEQGIAYLPEDRKTQGLFLNQGISFNASVSALGKRFSRHNVIDDKLVAARTEELVEKLKIKADGLYSKVDSLSGGNQQKVLLGKCMMDRYKVLIMEEPTRGVDVGAKVEIYYQMSRMLEEGLSIIVYSTELTELLGMCDRIIVFAGGRMTAEIGIEEATEEKIMQHAIVR